MNNYTKAVLMMIALNVCALPVGAEEKVWYCEMTGFAQTNMEGEKNYKLEKFKFKVTPKEIVFGVGGFFGDFEIPISYWRSNNDFQARGFNSTIRFIDNQLHYGNAETISAMAISARCDDF